MRKTAIGLAGPAGVGKTTVQEMIVEWCGDNGVTVDCINFADSLKELAQFIDPFVEANEVYIQPSEVDHDLEWLKANSNYRDFLVALGHGAREIVDPDIWLNAWKRRVASSEADLIVAADIRYLNEAYTVSALPRVGETWYLLRGLIEPANATEKSTLHEIWDTMYGTDRMTALHLPEGRLDLMRKLIYTATEEMLSS